MVVLACFVLACVGFVSLYFRYLQCTWGGIALPSLMASAGARRRPIVIDSSPSASDAEQPSPAKRRKRRETPQSEDDLDFDSQPESSGSDSASDSEVEEARPRLVFGGIAVPHLDHASSVFSVESPSSDALICPRSQSERSILDQLLDDGEPDADDDGNIYVDLDDFAVYRPASAGKRPLTFLGLNEIYSGGDQFQIDGTLCSGSQRLAITGMTLCEISVEGFGRASPDEQTDVYLRTVHTRKTEIYYRLKSPAASYKRYHDPFLWLCEFAIHFIAYLEQLHARGETITFAHFKHRFYAWLISDAVKHIGFDDWLKTYARSDFRHIMIANAEFLYDQTSKMTDDLHELPFWAEFDGLHLNAVEKREVVEEQTIVTSFAYDCFRDSYFRSSLKEVSLHPETETAWRKRGHDLSLACLSRAVLDDQRRRTRQDVVRTARREATIKTGDVVVLDPETEGPWTNATGDWFAYVQDVKHDRHGPLLRLIWLYKPEDTICHPGLYPFQTELFMSDHCNCEDDVVRPQDVKATVDAEFNPKDIETSQGLFVRQMYITSDEEAGKDTAFVTLKQEHFRCWHQRRNRTTALEDASRDYPPGSTVLVKLPGERFLEPFILDHVSDDGISVRRLLRRAKFEPAARPNEVLETAESLDIVPLRIIRKCRVRRFSADAVRCKRVPAPFSYDGTADCWCLTGSLSSHQDDIEPVDMSGLPSFNEDVDPEAMPALSGLSLFSGGGLFDRGLEDSRATKTKFVVEIDSPAIHTYRANLEDTQEAQLYLGSVNDYLKYAMHPATNVPFIAHIGEVDVIVAGSPCKGFSLATQDKLSEKAKGYASLVASVVGYINFYFPRYVFLENVRLMCSRVKGQTEENVFSQIMSALVAMGYQVSIFNCDAWTAGSSQSRSRLFIMAAAPGLEPLKVPAQTHTHPPATRGHKIGETQCGTPYGMRTPSDIVCPFPFVSARQATGDLPPIGDGIMSTMIQYPDHRLHLKSNYEKFAMTIRAIPRFPYRQSLMKAYDRMGHGLQALHLYRNSEFHKENSKAYQRIDPNGLLPTIKTSQSARCARMGGVVHWDEHRQLTVQENRRAQSIPDHEVMVGSANQQLKIIGNGVDRKAAVAVGMSLRDSWASSREHWPAVRASAAVEGTRAEDILPGNDVVDGTALDVADDILPDTFDDFRMAHPGPTTPPPLVVGGILTGSILSDNDVADGTHTDTLEGLPTAHREAAKSPPAKPARVVIDLTSSPEPEPVPKPVMPSLTSDAAISSESETTRTARDSASVEAQVSTAGTSPQVPIVESDNEALQVKTLVHRPAPSQDNDTPEPPINEPSSPIPIVAFNGTESSRAAIPFYDILATGVGLSSDDSRMNFDSVSENRREQSVTEPIHAAPRLPPQQRVATPFHDALSTGADLGSDDSRMDVNPVFIPRDAENREDQSMPAPGPVMAAPQVPPQQRAGRGYSPLLRNFLSAGLPPEARFDATPSRPGPSTAAPSPLPRQTPPTPQSRPMPPTPQPRSTPHAHPSTPFLAPGNTGMTMFGYQLNRLMSESRSRRQSQEQGESQRQSQDRGESRQQTPR